MSDHSGATHVHTEIFRRGEAIEPEPEFDEDGNVIEKEPAEESAPEAADAMQTFVFSATLSKDLQRNLKKRTGSRKKNAKPASTLGTATRLQ